MFRHCVLKRRVEALRYSRPGKRCNVGPAPFISVQLSFRRNAARAGKGNRKMWIPIFVVTLAVAIGMSPAAYSMQAMGSH